MTKTTMTANDCWETAHYALCQGRWSDARRALDELGRRNDNGQLLCDASAYGCPEHLLGVIGDRIDLVNFKAELFGLADTIDAT